MEQIAWIFWIKLVLFCMSLYVVITIFSIIMRRLLHVKKEKPFSYNHINEQHKKWDWVIRIGFIVLMIPITFVGNYWSEQGNSWMYLPIIGTLLFIMLTEMLKAYMQWHHSENRNDYVFTIVQLVFIICLMITVVITDFFGLFH